MMHEKSALLGLTIGALSFQLSYGFFVGPFSRGLSFRALSSTSPVVVPDTNTKATNAIIIARSPFFLKTAASSSSSSSSSSTALFASNLNSNDPFEVLDLQPSPTLDKKQIKRAYKRLALQYHPDVATNQSSTPEEKKRASDLFSKINWAYETLSGKNGDTTSTAASASSTTTSASSSGYTPPHRRTTSNPYTRSNSNNPSTDWSDFMPKYNEEDYDSGGDSFGQIFSDLLTGVAAAAASSSSSGSGSNGIFRDFVEFLERNVDVSDNDVELISLLQTGTLQDVGHEMDDTELVVEQLSSKLRNIDDDLIMVQAELRQPANKYMRALELEERVAELEARKKVVKGYLQKARKRLVALQTRYKELIVGGANDDRVGRSSRSQRSAGVGGVSSSERASSDSGSSGTYRSSTSTSSTTSASSRVGTQNTSTGNSEDAWKQEGFGSSGRGRGSSRRRASSAAGSRSRTVEDFPPPPPPPRQPSYTSSSSSSFSSPTPRGSASTSYQPSSTIFTSSDKEWSAPVPPHRRTNVKNDSKDDTKRMRELKVDEEFEKLKRDLGL